MARTQVSLLKEAALAAAVFLLAATPALAGDRVHAPSRTASTRSQPASAPVARAQPVVVSFVMAQPTQPAKEPFQVSLRGPDGQVRRFTVEGGEAAIQYRQVVLRPGQSVTIRWVKAR
jgi:hypothetical protein